MKLQNVVINGVTISIPAFFQKVNSMPDDPKDSIPYMVRTENAECFVLIFPVNKSESLPRKKDSLIAGIRQFLANNQGLIQVEAEREYVYSIVKSLKAPSGVQYILTYQEFHPEFILNVQGFFDEIGTTGIRDSLVYELYRRENAVGTDDDPFTDWVKDPYDEAITEGALMNLSEKEQFDAHFPGFPLTICRDVIRALIKSSETA